MKKLLLLAITIFSVAKGVSQKRKFGKITKEELKESVCSIDSIAEAAYLHKYKDVTFDYSSSDGFQKTIKIHHIIKIYNKEGFDLGNQSIKYMDRKSDGTVDKFYKIKATTYNLVNGKIEKSEVKKKEIIVDKNNEFYSYKKVAFPNVKEGSIIELSYELISDSWSIFDVVLQEEIPIKSFYHSTTIPEYLKYKKSSKGYMSLVPEVKNKNNVLILGNGADQSTLDYTEKKTIFQKENIAALRDDEPYTASYKDYVGTVGYELSSVQFPNSYLKSYSATWESVCKTLYDYRSFGAQLKKRSYFSSDLKIILAGKTSEEEIIETIFSFVKSKVTWDNYYGIYAHKGVKEAYKTGTGNIADINLMLVAMLRSSGLDANPVLLSTKKNGVPLFPTLNGLNYVIAAVESKNGRILLDASNPFNAMNVLPSRAANWEGRLLINENKTLGISLEDKKASQEHMILDVTFDADFKLKGNFKCKLTSRKAYDFRKKYNNLSEEKFIKKINNKYKTKITSFEIKNKNELSQPIIFNGEIDEDGFCETINGKKYINPMLLFKESKNPFTLDTRKFPVDLVSPSKEMKSITINIPEGYKVASLPKNLYAKMTNKKGSYRFMISQLGQKINIMAVKEFKTNIILPSEYAELKGLYTMLIAKNNEQIVLEKI